MKCPSDSISRGKVYKPLEGKSHKKDDDSAMDMNISESDNLQL